MSLWDPIRLKWVASTPEEKVRQRLIARMLHLGFPKGLIAVEKKILERRFDLLCYVKKGSSLFPLLLAECKAEKIDEKAISQAMGYNESLRAPFVCLCSQEEIKTIWFERGALKSVSFLPPFKELTHDLPVWI